MSIYAKNYYKEFCLTILKSRAFCDAKDKTALSTFSIGHLSYSTLQQTEIAGCIRLIMPTKSESFLLLYSDWAPHILPTAGHARRCLRSRQTAPQPYCWQQPTSVWTPLSSSLKTRMKKLEPSRWGVRDMYFQENGDVKKSRLKFLTQYILISVFLQCCKQRGERSSVPNF